MREGAFHAAGKAEYFSAGLWARRFSHNKIGWNHDLGIGGAGGFDLLKKEPKRLLDHAGVVLPDAGKLHSGNLGSQRCITRASVMTVRNNEYIESAKAIGGSNFYIIMTQVLPNCFSPILVQATLRMGTTIISAAGLSYIGLGVPVPTPEWGALLNASKDFIIDKPYLCFFPGLAIMITVMAINLVGDGLRDALDPKLKR